MQFERYSVADGLSSYPITALTQDHRGFLWIGTLDGLNRYDGYEFVVYRHDPQDANSLSDNFINTGALFEQAGSLWIGTRNGLNRLDPATGKVTHFHHYASDPASLRNDNVTALAALSSDALWVGTGDGLERLDLATNRFTFYELAPGSPYFPGADKVNALAVDRRGVLWAGTARGLYRYDVDQDRFARVENDRGVPFTYVVSALRPASDGALWVGTESDGVIRLTPETGAWVRYAHHPKEAASLPVNQVLSLLEDRAGTLWVGTWRGGLCRLEAATNTFACANNRLDDPRSLSNDLVTSLLEDQAGNLFIGTWDGLNKRIEKKAFRVLRRRPEAPDRSLSHPRVNAVYQDEEGILWVGTLGGGLDRIDRKSGRVTHFRSDPEDPATLGSDQVWTIAEGPDGAIWVGEEGGGVSRLDRKRRRFRRYVHDPNDPSSLSDNLVYSIYFDRARTMWVGTVRRGLDRYDRDRDAFTSFRHVPGDTTSLSHSSVWPLLEDRKGRFWVGTVGGGLNLMDRKRGTFTHYLHDPKDPNSLSDNRIMALAEDRRGRLWVGTLGGGLNRFDPEEGRFTRYTTKDGLAHNNADCILPGDGDDLWIGTTNGLSYLDLTNETFTTYTVRDGLPTPIFHAGACFKSTKGELFFGTAAGLVSFFPSAIHANPVPPPVVLTAFELYSEPFALDSSLVVKKVIRLRYDQNFVAFRFAALDFTAPPDNRYAYRLDGVDEDWVQAGKRRYARYPNLAPGKYRFRVKGTNNDGVWSTREASVRLVIAPPFWETLWFRLALAGLILFIAWEVHHLRLQQRLQLEQMQRKIEVERERTRLRIARDLHDDIGSELTGIAFALERAGRSSELSRSKRRRLLDVWERIRKVSEHLRDMTWILETEHDHLPDLVDRLYHATFHLAPEENVRFIAPADLPDLSISMDLRRHIYLIYKEALHNAVRHAGTGRIMAQVRYADGVLTVTVTDEGRGFDPDQVSAGHGLRYMAERARMIGGELHIESTPGNGATVRLTVRMA